VKVITDRLLHYLQSLTKKAGLSKLRVYLTGNNLLTLTKYNGFDPEISAAMVWTGASIRSPVL
jgi:hypothetical protein